MTRKKLSRRAALAGLGGLAAAAQMRLAPEAPAAAFAQVTGRPPDEKVPVNGRAGPGLERFDSAMLTIMDRHGIPGAAFAIAKDGKLVLAKGYGWANVATGEAVRPETLFGLASVSKPLTAIAVLKLVEQSKLKLDDRVFGLLGHIQPPAGT